MTAPNAVSLPQGDPGTWNQQLDVALLSTYVNATDESGLTTTEQGMRLQNLVAWLLSHVPGFVVHSGNQWSASASQEVDLALWNEQETLGGLAAFGPTIIVECKNTADKVGARDVAWFDWKMRLGGVGNGILVSRAGITGDAQNRSAAYEIISLANAEERHIMLLDVASLATLGSREELRRLLIEARMRLLTRS